MKQYRITLEESTFDVTVLDDPRQDHVRVQVNGEIFTVGVAPVPVVAEGPVGEAVPVTLPPVIAAPAPARAGTARVETDQAITAPLPGVIKSIAVRPSQQVAPGDELLVIEAMKMDNIIRATRAGTIGTIHVTEGRQVAYGELLLEIALEA